MEKIAVKNDDKYPAEKPVYVSSTPVVHYGAPAPSPEPVEKFVNFKKKKNSTAPTHPV